MCGFGPPNSRISFHRTDICTMTGVAWRLVEILHGFPGFLLHSTINGCYVQNKTIYV